MAKAKPTNKVQEKVKAQPKKKAAADEPEKT